MSRIARLAVVALTAAALAIVPAMAQAGPGHGNRCGKGHTKHTRAVGKKCAKHRKARAKHREKIVPVVVPAEVVTKCKDEQTADEVAFQQKYANAAGREALGRCIRLNAENKAGDLPEPKPQNDFATAAQQCATEKAADAAAFLAKYGDENGREAFGRCVHQNAKPVAEDPAGDDGTPAGDDATEPEQGDDGADGGEESGGEDGTAVEAIPGLDSLFF
jgi:hypothetical protein